MFLTKSIRVLITWSRATEGDRAELLLFSNNNTNDWICWIFIEYERKIRQTENCFVLEIGDTFEKLWGWFIKISRGGAMAMTLDELCHYCARSSFCFSPLNCELVNESMSLHGFFFVDLLYLMCSMWWMIETINTCVEITTDALFCFVSTVECHWASPLGASLNPGANCDQVYICFSLFQFSNTCVCSRKLIMNSDWMFFIAVSLKKKWGGWTAVVVHTWPTLVFY